MSSDRSAREIAIARNANPFSREDAIPPHRGRFYLIARPLIPLTYRWDGSFIFFVSFLFRFFLSARIEQRREKSRPKGNRDISLQPSEIFYSRHFAGYCFHPSFFFFFFSLEHLIYSPWILHFAEKKIGVKCAKYFLIAPSPFASPRPAIRPIIDSRMLRFFYSPLANKNN